MIGLVLIILAIFAFHGCLNPVSIEDNGYVISVGADIGKERRFAFTFMLQRESSGQSGDKEGGAIILTGEGDDIYEAINSVESSYPSILNFARTEFFIFGREAAQSGAIEEILSIPLDSLRIRASAVVITAEDTAQSFIGGLSSNNEDNITRLQTAILHDKERTGMAIVSSLGRFYEATNECIFDFCSALGGFEPEVITDMNQKKSENEGEDPLKKAESGTRIGGLMSYIKGTALYDGWTMKAELDLNETMLLNMATGEFKEGTYTFEYGDGEICTILLEMKKCKTAFNGFDDNGAPVFDLTIELYAVVLRQNDISAKISNELINTAEINLKNCMDALHKKCAEANCDAMRLGTAACKRFSSTDEWESFYWKSRFSDSKLNVSIRIKLVNEG